MFFVMPSRSCISSLRSPLLSRNETFFSVEALRTSSSSRNFFACSIMVARLGDSGAGFSSSFAESTFVFSCHDGTPAFFSPSSESLIVNNFNGVKR